MRPLSSLLCLLSAWPIVSADAQTNLSRDIAQLLGSVQRVALEGTTPTEPLEAAYGGLAEDGYLNHLSTPPGHEFPPAPGVALTAEAGARDFLTRHGPLFGISSPAVAFDVIKRRTRSGRSFIRFQQTYARLPVYGAQLTVQLNSHHAVQHVASDIQRDTRLLDDGTLSLKPSLSSAEASAQAVRLLEREAAGQRLTHTQPRLAIFAPSVVGQRGPPRLAWELDAATADEFTLNERLLLDAQTGALLRRVTHRREVLARRIYDAENSTVVPEQPIRSEGDPPSGVADADKAYAFIQDVYNFYLSHHEREGFDFGSENPGRTNIAIVRYCTSGKPCPLANAYAGKNRLKFGDGWVADEVVAHEFTHLVTDYESNLEYQDESGAINESFSDIWGEFVDQTNGAGNDGPEVRWLVGEDLPDGAIRYMGHPPLMGDPDRLGSPYYRTGSDDYGGVHSNSGVNNKLCYLLTAGDTFNCQTVVGMGLNRVADLYYEVQVGLLNSSAGWTDLYHALRQAAINLGWTPAEQANLQRACIAVEIAPYAGFIHVDGSSHCLFPNGACACADWPLTEPGGPFSTVALGAAFAPPNALLLIRAGTYSESVTFTRPVEIRSYEGVATIDP